MLQVQFSNDSIKWCLRLFTEFACCRPLTYTTSTLLRTRVFIYPGFNFYRHFTKCTILIPTYLCHFKQFSKVNDVVIGWLRWEKLRTKLWTKTSNLSRLWFRVRNVRLDWVSVKSKELSLRIRVINFWEFEDKDISVSPLTKRIYGGISSW